VALDELRKAGLRHNCDWRARRMPSCGRGSIMAEQALERARAQDWTVVSIKDDWAAVFADHP
jgi:hypothetical protein